MTTSTFALHALDCVPAELLAGHPLVDVEAPAGVTKAKGSRFFLCNLLLSICELAHT